MICNGDDGTLYCLKSKPEVCVSLSQDVSDDFTVGRCFVDVPIETPKLPDQSFVSDSESKSKSTSTDDSEQSCQQTLQARQAGREHRGHPHLALALPAKDCVADDDVVVGAIHLLIHPDDGDGID